MWPFKPKSIAIPPEVKEKLTEETLQLIEVLARNGLPEAINQEIEKTIKSADYFQYLQDYEESGNYFGQEFELRATAGRIKSLYTREPWIFTAAWLIARTLVAVPKVVRNIQTNEIDDNHPLNKQLVVGSAIQDSLSMHAVGNLDYVLGGNYIQVFDEKFQTSFHAPVERVRVDVDRATYQIKSYSIYDALRGSIVQTVPAEQVVHRKFPNPFNPYYGLSLFMAASRPILLDRMKNEFEMAFYLRGATNAGVIEVTEDINRTRIERLLRSFEQLYTGKRNWFRTIFLPKGSKWVSTGLSMSDIQHLEGLRENRLTILAVLGIPPSKVGIVQDVNRSTSDNQDKDFWENTIQPLALLDAEAWNNSYLVKTVYKGLVRVEPDFSNVEALEMSLKQRGEQGKAVEDFLYIDEIRQDVLGYEPLPDGKGQRFVSEVRGSRNNLDEFFLNYTPGKEDLGQEEIEDSEAKAVASVKASAVASQERVEKKLGKAFVSKFDEYMEMLFKLVSKSLKEGTDVRQALQLSVEDRQQLYLQKVGDVLNSALARGFSLANANTKGFLDIARKVKALKNWTKQLSVSHKRLIFGEVDQQAIDALRAVQEDGQRETLVARAIESFVGFDSTMTDRIVGIIEEEFEKGETFEKIAESIRDIYGESYKNQSFTIARTEVLTATSQGLKWNHDVLGEVFSRVEKQWLHVGDVGSNPDARESHFDFEKLGAQESSYRYGGMLEYPRDPAAPADETINCRCTLVSVIPDDAHSNAEVILETL